MSENESNYVVNSPKTLMGFVARAYELVNEHKYVTFSWRIGADRSLDQNALLHVWLTEYAAYLLEKPKSQVSESELEGMKKIAKKRFYQDTGADWMVYRPFDPFTGEYGALALRSSKRYSRGEMFDFLTWLQATASQDGLMLESKGQYAKLQREQNQ